MVKHNLKNIIHSELSEHSRKRSTDHMTVVFTLCLNRAPISCCNRKLTFKFKQRYIAVAKKNFFKKKKKKTYVHSS